MDLIKITPDIERAKSLLKLSEIRYKKLDSYNKDDEAVLIIEAYYEICKELITAILFCEGYKTLSHKELVEYMKRYEQFNESDIFRLDDLRKKRNKLVYYGEFIDGDYIERNKTKFEIIISKLKDILNQKIK